MNDPIAVRRRVVPHDLAPLLNNYHSMKMIDIRQFWHLEKLATLTHLYLGLRLPLAGAIQAAKADLQMDSLPGATQQVLERTRVSGKQLGDVHQSCLGLSSDDFSKSYLSRIFYPQFAWHEMVERYIEGSGVAWSHIHPHFFMDNLLTSVPVVNGRFYWFMGDKRVGWITADDLATVSAQVLAEGPKGHARKQYWLSTEVMNGVEAAAEIAEGRGQPVDQVPADAANGSVDAPSSVGTSCCGSVKRAPRIESAQQPLASRFRCHNLFRAIGSLFGKLHSDKVERHRAVAQVPGKSQSTDAWKVPNSRSRQAVAGALP